METKDKREECPICKGSKKESNKHCSKQCYWESMKGLKNEKANNWRGNKAGIAAVHNWLQVNFGKPSMCENPICQGKSTTYDWAKKTEAEYTKDRNAFLRLCRSCHRSYDLTPNKRNQAIKNLWWRKGQDCPGVPHPENLWWNKDKQKMELKSSSEKEK